ncbi:MAG: CopY family transcriptional regulator [Pseudonocardia sp. SCN 72-86]|nr:MAG: CopY family transcriptional regulator [Pseudonocardia sp. SCN 72-86]
MVGRRNPRPKGALEHEIVACLAATDAALTPAQVQAGLGRPLAYTTVLTTLTRLFDKEVLTRETRGRAFAYRLVGDRTEAEARLTAREMQKLLDAGSDRAGVLTQFVGSLDAASEEILRAALQRHADQGPDGPADRADGAR